VYWLALHSLSLAASWSQSPRLTMIKHLGPSIHFTCLHVISTCSITILFMTVLLALHVEWESPAENVCYDCEVDCLECLPSDSQEFRHRWGLRNKAEAQVLLAAAKMRAHLVSMGSSLVAMADKNWSIAYLPKILACCLLCHVRSRRKLCLLCTNNLAQAYRMACWQPMLHSLQLV